VPGTERYARQILFKSLGPEGQERLGLAAALLVGCGALGSQIAELLVRSGIGRLRIVDRDFVEESNLQRQSLFDEADVREGLPKAIAAKRRLNAINSGVPIEPFAEHVDADSIDRHAAGVGLILDGTDNFETRFLLNDYSLKHHVPWIYGACIGAYGLSMTILPGRTPCLRCLVHALPAAGAAETCDTAGVIAPIAALIAAVQAAEAIKILSGGEADVSREVVAVDLWTNSMQRLRLDREEVSRDCPACSHGVYEYLEEDRGAHTTTLCGRNAVQIRLPRADRADLQQVAARLRPVGRVVQNRFLVRAEVEGYVLAVFVDGRAIVSGTTDPVRARSLYDRFVGG
jgi:molybdopterin/thiamine biosynthesis adenylyltransferase